jgi:hypothetical protein
MPDDKTSPDTNVNAQTQIEAVRKSLQDLKTILDQLNKARSVVCTILNVTDSSLTFEGADHDHGGFAANPPPIISPRIAVAFGSQSSGGALFTGTEGTVRYSGGNFHVRFHWNNPFFGQNSSNASFDGDPLRFMTFNTTGAGDQRAEMQFVIFERPFQNAWRFCPKCNAMFFDGFPSKGVCPKGGGHEAAGFDFGLMHDAPAPGPAQADWRFCRKCNAMFFNGFVGKGTCPAGGPHEAAGFNFVLPHDVPGPGQPDWRFCQKCDTLFFDGFKLGPLFPHAKGTCPADRRGHQAAGFNFVLNHG